MLLKTILFFSNSEAALISPSIKQLISKSEKGLFCLYLSFKIECKEYPYSMTIF